MANVEKSENVVSPGRWKRFSSPAAVLETAGTIFAVMAVVGLIMTQVFDKPPDVLMQFLSIPIGLFLELLLKRR